MPERLALGERLRVDRRVLRARLGVLQSAVPLILQASVAAGLAWVLVTRLGSAGSPVFAPIAAVATVAVAQTKRIGRTVEFTVGVALGVLLGDLLVALLGTGPVQVAVVVGLAMSAVIMLGGGPTLMIQTAASAIIIAAIEPPRVEDLFFAVRGLDAAIGGAIGVLVSALLLPVNPLVIARRTAPDLLTELERALAELAGALRDRDPLGVRTAAERARGIEAPLRVFVHAMEVASEATRMAPLRWRLRSALEPYVQVGYRMDHVVRNLRVLTRRSRTLIGQDEPVPPGIANALDGMAGGVRLLLDDLLRGEDPQRARAELLRACRMTADVPEGMTISGQVVVGQLRSTVVDLLRAGGLSYADADDAVRRAITAPRLRPGTTLLPVGSRLGLSGWHRAEAARGDQ